MQWINSYLTDSEHFVSWNQTHSPSLNLNIGVTQGSILGSLLFLIYLMILLITLISCHSFSLLITLKYMFNMQLMVQSKKIIYYSLIIGGYLLYLLVLIVSISTYCINKRRGYLLYQCLVLYLLNKFKNPMYSPIQVSAYTLCYCSAAPFERYLRK